MPFLFPPVSVDADDQTRLLLTDGGVSDCVPIEFAQRWPLESTHLIVSDCRWHAGGRISGDENVVYIRPRLASTGTFWAPASTLVSAVREGRRAVTDEILRTIRGWIHGVAT